MNHDPKSTQSINGTAILLKPKLDDISIGETVIPKITYEQREFIPIYVFFNNELRKIDPVSSGLIDKESGCIYPPDGFYFADFSNYSQARRSNFPDAVYNQTAFAVAASRVGYDMPSFSNIMRPTTDRLLNLRSTGMTRSTMGATLPITPEQKSIKSYSKIKQRIKPQFLLPPVVKKKAGQSPSKAIYRKRQKLIIKAYDSIMSFCIEKGIAADPEEKLIGDDTLRYYASSVLAIKNVENLLHKLYESFKISKVQTLFSMKTKRQRKGFIVFVQFTEINDIPNAQEIIDEHDSKIKELNSQIQNNHL